MALRADDLVPVTEARDHFKKLLDRVIEEDIVLVRRSRPAAVMLSPDRYRELLERIEELTDQASVLWAQLHPEDDRDLEEIAAEL